jgi:hypothetical protein
MSNAFGAMSPTVRLLLTCVGIVGLVTMALVFALRKGEGPVKRLVPDVALAEIPSIDSAAPATYETATFALG